MDFLISNIHSTSRPLSIRHIEVLRQNRHVCLCVQDVFLIGRGKKTWIIFICITCQYFVSLETLFWWACGILFSFLTREWRHSSVYSENVHTVKLAEKQTHVARTIIHCIRPEQHLPPLDSLTDVFKDKAKLDTVWRKLFVKPCHSEFKAAIINICVLPMDNYSAAPQFPCALQSFQSPFSLYSHSSYEHRFKKAAGSKINQIKAWNAPPPPPCDGPAFGLHWDSSNKELRGWS